jgi:Na+/H+-dicarboxylate symporter
VTTNRRIALGLLLGLAFGLIAAATVAGVPSAGVITLAPAVTAVGIPLGGLPILLGVDRIPDMVRTATQVTGHLAAATVLERTAGADIDRPAEMRLESPATVVSR